MPLVKDLHRELNGRLEKLQAAPSSPQTTEGDRLSEPAARRESEIPGA